MKSYKHRKAIKQAYFRHLDVTADKHKQTKSPDLAKLKDGSLARSDKKVMSHTSKARKPSMPKMPWN